jgi:hypothetical protein
MSGKPSREVEEIGVRAKLDQDSRRLVFKLSLPRRLRRYLRNEFWVRYDTSIASVPESIRIVPALGALAPVAWASGAVLRVQAADAAYLRYLDGARDALRRLYPHLAWSGDILAERVTAGGRIAGSASALLFSGGIDSLWAFFQRRQDCPALVTLHGTDLRLRCRQGWERIQALVRCFGRSQGVPVRFVSSNVREFLREDFLRVDFGLSWWAFVAHALASTAITAPLAAAEGWSRLYEASGSPAADGLDMSWGAHPDLVSGAGWSATAVIEVGLEFSRQDKINRLAAIIGAELPRLKVRVCWLDQNGENCGRCEKCCRTIAGLALAGLEADRHGFAADPGIFEHIRKSLTRGRWRFAKESALFWNDIRAHCPAARETMLPAARPFFAWLEQADMNSLQIASRRNLRWRLRAFIEGLPAVVLRQGLRLRRAFSHRS